MLNESYQEVCRVIHEFDGLVIRSRVPIDKNMIDLGLRLRFIARVGAGMENIDHLYAQSKGIICLNAPEGNRDAVGEHALGMLLALMNHMLKSDREVRGALWRRESNRGHEIMGKTVGIIGYGNTGGAFARRLQGFSARVIAYDKYKAGYGNGLVQECGMEEIYREADIVSLHIPLTEETDYLVNKKFLERFQKPIYLINTSRGRNVCTADLVQALQSGKVLGAALDVLEYERSSLEALESSEIPLALSYLYQSDQVILTPHVAGWTHESLYKLARVLLEKITALYQA